LKFVENPQMKLDKDPFPQNMNIVELDGKEVLIRSSQSESTKGKEVVIGEERPLKMIKQKIRRMANGERTRGGGGQVT
jgi:hypothetical protein